MKHKLNKHKYKYGYSKDLNCILPAYCKDCINAGIFIHTFCRKQDKPAGLTSTQLVALCKLNNYRSLYFHIHYLS